MKHIKDFLIDVVSAIKEFDVFGQIVDEELQTVENTVQQIIDDQFIETATEQGIARREKLLNIHPFADDTLESRRFRVKANWNNQLPYSQNQLEEKIISLVGENGYTLTVNYAEYRLTVKINLGQKRMLQDAKNMINNIAPCNLIVTVELQYNRHIDLARFTHQQLSTKTHAQLREEVL